MPLRTTLLALFCLAIVSAADAPVVVICGASTVSSYKPAQTYRGWGQFIGVFSNPAVKVVNLGKPGASTKTYLAEGLWSKALAAKPTWVLIQFGHNDAHGPGKPESTEANGEYSANLRRMVDEALAAGARPVLVSPVQRRQWEGEGRLSKALEPYAAAVLAVAAEKQVPVVDLHRRSGEEYLKMGKAATDAWSPAPKDVSHFNQDGARTVASWVAAALPKDYPHGSNPAAAPPAPPAGGTAEKPAGH